MFARVSTSLFLCSSFLVLGCGGEGSGQTTADALAKLDQQAQAEKRREEADKAPPPPKKQGLADGEVGAPWEREAVAAGLKVGTVLEYAQSGTDTKGKAVTDTTRCQVKKGDDKTAGIVCVQVEHPSKDPGAGQVATLGWSKFSPFFAVERPTPEFAAREKITVPAGEFDCVKTELKGFMGNHKTVWMIVDKPGIYAKVVDHGNANLPKDKTDMTYELAAINPSGG